MSSFFTDSVADQSIDSISSSLLCVLSAPSNISLVMDTKTRNNERENPSSLAKVTFSSLVVYLTSQGSSGVV